MRLCVLHASGMISVLTNADTWSRSGAEWPAEPGEQQLLENNPIDLFCLEYKSRDAVCGCARLLKSAYTTAMNMNQCGCHTDSGPADPGAKEAVTSATLGRPRQGRLINCHSAVIENQLLTFSSDTRQLRFESSSWPKPQTSFQQWQKQALAAARRRRPRHASNPEP